MALDFPVFAALAITLGVKHAFDADHLVAVSNLLTRRSGLDRAVGLGAAWAAGHLVTAAIVSAVLFFFADGLLPVILSRMELLVPVMLILVGLLALGAELRRFHLHRHAHQDGGPQHRHFHLHIKESHRHGAMAGIGVVHGLASNDELLVVLLIGLGASSWWSVFAGVALFSLGVLIGMLLYAAGVHFADRKIGSRWTAPALNVFFAFASLGYAVYLLAGGDGVNLLDGLVRLG